MIYVTRKERTLYFVKYRDFLKLLLQVSIRSFNYHQSSNSNEDRSSVKLTHVHTMHMSMRTALKDWDAYHATWEGNLFLSSRPSSRARLGSGLTKTFRLHSENNNARAYGFVRPGRAFSIQVPDLNWLPKTSDKLHKAEQMTMYSISSNLVALSDQVVCKSCQKITKSFHTGSSLAYSFKYWTHLRRKANTSNMTRAVGNNTCIDA